MFYFKQLELKGWWEKGNGLNENQHCNNLQQMMRSVAIDQNPVLFSIKHPRCAGSPCRRVSILRPACRVKTKFFHFAP